MKKLSIAVFFTCALLCFSILCRGQYEVNAGPAFAKQKSNYSNYDSKYKPSPVWVELWKFAKWLSSLLPGYHASAGFEPNTAAVKDNLGLQFGVGLGSKGGRFPYPGGTAKTSVFYLQIPVLVRYDHDINETLGIYAALGPYYAIALGGKYKDESGKVDIDFGNGTGDDLRRGDFGIKFRAGCRLKNKPITIGLHGDFGLRNLTPGGDDDFRLKNQMFGIQLGYIFDSFRFK